MVRALGIRRIPVAVVASTRNAKSVRSRYCRAVVTTPGWDDNPEAAIDAIVDWASEQAEKPVLYYQKDQDLLAVSRSRAKLSNYFRFVLPGKELVEDLVDKSRFCDLAKRKALPIPETLAVPAGANAAKILSDWNCFPCVLKPIMRSAKWHRLVGGDQKALPIEKRQELDDLLHKIDADADRSRFVLQASIAGGEENILSYHAYVRPTGEIVTEFTGRKIRTSPRRYGLSTYIEITDDHEVRRVGRDIVEKLGFSGVLKADFKRDSRDERIYLLEINPRFNLWHHPGTVAGAPIPEAVYWDCVDPRLVRPARSAKRAIHWMVPLSDSHALGEYLEAGQLTRLRWLYQVFTVEVNEGFQITDPLPAIVDVSQWLKRKFFRAAVNAG